MYASQTGVTTSKKHDKKSGTKESGKKDHGWVPIYRSETIKNNLNPVWRPFTLDLYNVCAGRLDFPIMIEVTDFDPNGRHDLIGRVTTTIRELQIMKHCTLVNPKARWRRPGSIEVLKCGPVASAAAAAPVAAVTTTTTVHAAPAPVPMPGYPAAAPMPGYPAAAPMPGYPVAPMPGYPGTPMPPYGSYPAMPGYPAAAPMPGYASYPGVPGYPPAAAPGYPPAGSQYPPPGSHYPPQQAPPGSQYPPQARQAAPPAGAPPGASPAAQHAAQPVPQHQLAPGQPQGSFYPPPPAGSAASFM